MTKTPETAPQRFKGVTLEAMTTIVIQPQGQILIRLGHLLRHPMLVRVMLTQAGVDLSIRQRDRLRARARRVACIRTQRLQDHMPRLLVLCKVVGVTIGSRLLKVT